MSWFDSHCHLQDEFRESPSDRSETAGHELECRGGELAARAAPARVLPEELPEVPRDPAPDISGLQQIAEDAVAAGVIGVVCIGTDELNSLQAISVAETLRSLPRCAMAAWATVGLHPHDASTGTEGVQRVLEGVLSDPERTGVVVAVGECGLDYHYDNSPRPQQREAFATQIHLAKEKGLALVVHSRDAWDDTIGILESEGVPERTVIHCFTGGPREAQRCLDLGAYLSFSGIITFKNASDVREAARLCPLDRVLIETDSPFLSPVPHRGETNRPALVGVIGQAIAQIKSVEEDELAAVTVASTLAIFDIAAP